MLERNHIFRFLERLHLKFHNSCGAVENPASFSDCNSASLNAFPNQRSNNLITLDSVNVAQNLIAKRPSIHVNSKCSQFPALEAARK